MRKEEYARQGKEGDLALQGHTGILYWKDPERQKDVVRNGWSFTEDRVYLDADGNLRYVSRTKFIMKVSGASVAPLEIERVLFNHPAVKDVAVIGKPDKERGEIPKGPAGKTVYAELQKRVMEEAKKAGIIQ